MTALNYKLQKYTPSYLSSLTKLLDECFDIENKDKLGLVKWKYFDNYLNNKTISYIALNKDQQVISHYANIPILSCGQDNQYKSMICTDMCTDNKFRGQGLISQLSLKVYQDVKRLNYDFSLGFSNDEGVKVDQHANNYGYIVVGKFVRYFKFVIHKKNINYKLIKNTKFNNDLYDKGSTYLKIKKDSRYLDWRYLKKPNSEYDIYDIVEQDKVIGHVVLRFVNHKCYIYDIIAQSDDKKVMVNILRSIENEALDHKVRLIIYNVLDNNYWKSLFNKYKYFKRTNNHINYYLTIKLHNQNLPASLILNKESWLLMNGDIL